MPLAQPAREHGELAVALDAPLLSVTTYEVVCVSFGVLALTETGAMTADSESIPTRRNATRQRGSLLNIS